MTDADPHALTLRASVDDGAAVLHVGGDVDAASVDALRDSLTDLVDAGHQRVVLDLSEVRFLDSTGLSAVVGAYARLRATGGGFFVVCTNDFVLHVFRLTGLDDTLSICSTVDEALSA